MCGRLELKIAQLDRRLELLLPTVERERERERERENDMSRYLKLQKREEITQIECHQKAPGTPFLTI